MEDFKQQFYNFVSQMHTKAYRQYKKEGEQQEREQYLEKNRVKFDKILDSLNEQDRNFAEEYINNQTYEESCANESMYIAGYRDCVKILRELEVI